MRRAPSAPVALFLGVPVVEDFPPAAGGAAVFLSAEWERGHIPVPVPKMRTVVPDAQRVGSATGEHRRARRIAYRLLRVGTVKLETPCRQPRQVWCYRNRAIAGKLRPEVIRH